MTAVKSSLLSSSGLASSSSGAGDALVEPEVIMLLNFLDWRWYLENPLLEVHGDEGQKRHGRSRDERQLEVDGEHRDEDCDDRHGAPAEIDAGPGDDLVTRVTSFVSREMR